MENGLILVLYVRWASGTAKRTRASIWKLAFPALRPAIVPSPHRRSSPEIILEAERVRRRERG
jgi:hypothetical protein